MPHIFMRSCTIYVYVDHVAQLESMHGQNAQTQRGSMMQQEDAASN